ncbi:hypothetical protein [Methylobacterium sp. Leaf117]|uniref:hypothetical protein n=1 Tax=Methylobacterium sp. Leaf117 TaxID=1736260 RepID=UPI0006F34C61|nr:hypothetical protein [Methylobacterium sp. Leaf117]KQP79251.1 hypothetical protein ASF57_18800 [Methylobacterium sp. Leaf117]
MPFVYRRRPDQPPPRQPLPEDDLWSRLAETRADEHGADLIREIALVQLRRARLQAGLANRKGEADDRRH